jgi:hypothetical protein
MGIQGEHIDPAGSESSGASLSEELEHISERSRPSTELRFALCEHHEPDDGTLAADTLKDCDLVALEAVGGSPEERLETEQKMNEFIHRAANGDIEEAMSLIADQDPFWRQFLRRLATHGPKRIVLIDASDEDTDITSTFQPYKEASDRYQEVYLSRLDEMRRAAREVIETGAARESKREALQITQLEHLAQPEAGDPPRKIGVVLGMGHTPTKDYFERAGYRTSQKQISVVDPGFLKQDFPQDFQTRSATFLRTHPGEPLPSSMVDRMILEDIYATSGVFGDPGERQGREARAYKNYQATKLVESMDDTDVERLLLTIDHWLETRSDEAFDHIDQELKENIDAYRQP